MTGLDVAAASLALVERLSSPRALAAGSLIVTVFGDAMRPRGGVLSLAALTRIMQPFGLNGGQIRTALSRLVADGWFVRSREGRASLYELSPERVDEFEHAERRIYAAAVPDTALALQQVMLPPARDAEQRLQLKQQLARLGYGALAPGVLVRAIGAGPAFEGGTAGLPALPSGTIVGRLVLDPADAADLVGWAAGVWPLSELGRQYTDLLVALDGLGACRAADGETAFVLRILVIHRYRRLVLRDPELPPLLLPADWAGTRARKTVADLYRRLLVDSEAWLSTQADAAGDALPPAGPDLDRRFC